MRLKEQIDEMAENDYIIMLSACMCTAEDGDEVIEALYEFVSNCKGFVGPEEEMTQQVTKEEFEEILSECEDKCALMSCIEESHIINVAEVPMYNKYREFGLRFKNNAINLFLPKIDINKDVKEYISEELGSILYNVLAKRLDVDFIRNEMYRYIPETRSEEGQTVRQPFKKYFYQVVLYKESLESIWKLMTICEEYLFWNFSSGSFVCIWKNREVNPLRKTAEFLHRYSPICAAGM